MLHPCRCCGVSSPVRPTPSHCTCWRLGRRSTRCCGRTRTFASTLPISRASSLVCWTNASPARRRTCRGAREGSGTGSAASGLGPLSVPRQPLGGGRACLGETRLIPATPVRAATALQISGGAAYRSAARAHVCVLWPWPRLAGRQPGRSLCRVLLPRGGEQRLQAAAPHLPGLPPGQRRRGETIPGFPAGGAALRRQRPQCGA